jgi:hypothetical protein
MNVVFAFFWIHRLILYLYIIVSVVYKVYALLLSAIYKLARPQLVLQN